MNIYEIKGRTEKTSPYFFSRNTLKFFHQTMAGFRVYKQDTGKYLITCPMKDNYNKIVGYTKRLFNPITNELEHFKEVLE